MLPYRDEQGCFGRYEGSMRNKTINFYLPFCCSVCHFILSISSAVLWMYSYKHSLMHHRENRMLSYCTVKLKITTDTETNSALKGFRGLHAGRKCVSHAQGDRAQRLEASKGSFTSTSPPAASTNTVCLQIS